jgi:drug/metabolite transporter (DMT)-like permease
MKILTKYIVLIGINLLYACVTIFTKLAAQQEFMSISYCLGLCGAIGVMGAYAICWQQVLKHIDISSAYMFKGTSLIIVMLLAYAIFGEVITIMNIIGSIMILLGIALFAKSDI